MCCECGQPARVPCATKRGEPHLHICGCGHRWIAPLGSDPSCPGCTDEYGANWLDRQAIRIAKGVVERFGIEVLSR